MTYETFEMQGTSLPNARRRKNAVAAQLSAKC